MKINYLLSLALGCMLIWSSCKKEEAQPPSSHSTSNQQPVYVNCIGGTNPHVVCWTREFCFTDQNGNPLPNETVGWWWDNSPCDETNQTDSAGCWKIDSWYNSWSGGPPDMNVVLINNDGMATTSVSVPGGPEYHDVQLVPFRYIRVHLTNTQTLNTCLASIANGFSNNCNEDNYPDIWLRDDLIAPVNQPIDTTYLLKGPWDEFYFYLSYYDQGLHVGNWNTTLNGIVNDTLDYYIDF